jgi:protein-S-isoprenylcysteine O-methyltransferase Ste14
MLLLARWYDSVFSAEWVAPVAAPGQVLGLVALYTGSLLLAWTVHHAGRSLRPSTSGTLEDHELIQDGPLGIVRHPYYVSYVPMLLGLGLTLASPWPLALALCVVIGMGPTARAEEAHLTTMFGQEYVQYQQRVGRFFPKILGRGG